MIKQAVLIGAISQLRKSNDSLEKKAAVPVPEAGILSKHIRPLWSKLKASPHAVPVLLGITGAMLLKDLLD